MMLLLSILLLIPLYYLLKLLVKFKFQLEEVIVVLIVKDKEKPALPLKIILEVLVP